MYDLTKLIGLLTILVGCTSIYSSNPCHGLMYIGLGITILAAERKNVMLVGLTAFLAGLLLYLIEKGFLLSMFILLAIIAPALFSYFRTGRK